MIARLWLLAAALCLALAGCGVSPESAPTPITVTPGESVSVPPRAEGPVDARVYFVRGGRLVPVQRELSDGSLPTALAALVAGPTEAEAAEGIRTSLAPQTFRIEPSDRSTQVAGIVVTAQFTSVSGPDQLLAVAQLVWTATEVPGTRLARFYLDGKSLVVPTDNGLTRQAVGRSDFTSVRPKGGST